MYTAREIKDRVAVGDDKFNMTQLDDGRVQLTPAPDRVVEPGTDVNKGLLQAYENTLQTLSDVTFATAMMAVSGWSGNQYSFETTYPNTQYDIEIFPNNTCTEDQIDAWGSALITGSATTNIATALGDVPTVDIPIIIQVRKKVSE